MRHRPWFKVWQDRIRSSLCYHTLKAEHRGVLFDFWQLCGREYNQKLTLSLPVLRKNFGLNLNKLEKICLRLRIDGWIKFNLFPKQKVDILLVEIMGWEEAQSPSDSTERVRRHRKNMKRSNVSCNAPEEEEEEDKKERKNKTLPTLSSDSKPETFPKIEISDEEGRALFLAAREKYAKLKLQRRLADPSDLLSGLENIGKACDDGK